MRMYILAFFMSVLGYSLAYISDADTWVEKSDMPTPRSWLSTSIVNGKIYAIGGHVWIAKQNVWQPISTVEEYDPITNTWARKADMPTERGLLSTSAVNGKIYAIGGVGNDISSAGDQWGGKSCPNIEDCWSWMTK